ncbi:hypothetical protein E2C01_067749 [Portunus trituberculatus]|uniref:Uncharacterized protein n=1 Tax=Portunus trituberculatus TaxID=210409 RepID=A0A5B7HKM8_PORTR|nr:hypothetical protein [Portunus trituberculatus]
MRAEARPRCRAQSGQRSHVTVLVVINMSPAPGRNKALAGVEADRRDHHRVPAITLAWSAEGPARNGCKSGPSGVAVYRTSCFVE